MEKLIRTSIILAGILISILACKEELHPLTPPKDPGCEAPPIEKNIVGEWHFNRNGQTGTVTFTANKNIIDPDSLIGNSINIGGRVTDKQYDFTTIKTSPTESRLFLLIRQIAEKGSEGTYYTIEVNECKRVLFALGGSTSASFELIR